MHSIHTMWYCVYGWVMRCDYTHHAQGNRVGLQRRLFGANNATALSKANIQGRPSDNFQVNNDPDNNNGLNFSPFGVIKGPAIPDWTTPLCTRGQVIEPFLLCIYVYYYIVLFVFVGREGAERCCFTQNQNPDYINKLFFEDGMTACAMVRRFIAPNVKQIDGLT